MDNSPKIERGDMLVQDWPATANVPDGWSRSGSLIMRKANDDEEDARGAAVYKRVRPEFTVHDRA